MEERRHMIEFSDVIKREFDYTVAYSFGKESYKQLFAIVEVDVETELARGYFIVKDHDEVVIQTQKLREAIKVYNKCR